MGINVPEDTGTGFLGSHRSTVIDYPKVYNSNIRIEYSDESLWTFREYKQVKNNDMIIYPSSMFHQRYPTVQPKGEDWSGWHSLIMEENNDSL